MSTLDASSRASMRSLLVLGRVSNLPTVWSNCLAGWLLGGSGPLWTLIVLCLGATCLYIGGMYLNDAFDVEFDRKHRRERPVPSGAIRLETVWKLGGVFLLLGTACLVGLNLVVGVFTAMLAGAIVLYDAVHKKTVLAPVLMSACRFLLFLLAAAAGQDGIDGLVIWCAVALAAYITGLSYVARFESAAGALRYWPSMLLVAPVVLAWLANTGPYAERSLILSTLLLGWIVWCATYTFVASRKNYGGTVSGLLAGIVLVDFLAVCVAAPPFLMAFPILFMAALLFQRFIPAT